MTAYSTWQKAQASPPKKPPIRRISWQWQWQWQYGRSFELRERKQPRRSIHHKHHHQPHTRPSIPQSRRRSRSSSSNSHPCKSFTTTTRQKASWPRYKKHLRRPGPCTATCYANCPRHPHHRAPECQQRPVPVANRRFCRTPASCNPRSERACFPLRPRARARHQCPSRQ